VRVVDGAEVTVRGNLTTGQIESIHEGKGELRVISKPERCTIRFRGKRWDKTRQKLNISHIPAGEHRIDAEWGGIRHSTRILIIDGQRAIVHVNFMKKEAPFTVTHEPK
jgi:hypothetical protein